MMKFILSLASVCFIIKTIYELIQYISDKRYAEKQGEYWRPFNEKRRQEWYGICYNCGKEGSFHRLHGKKYCAMCHARIKTEHDFSKKIQGEKMQLNKALDEAIRIYETSKNSDITAGYIINGMTYPNYVSNDSWADFCTDMQINHPKAYENYKNGDGKELDERKVGANIYPPKMASFGSSSRFIYNLMKKDIDFSFEEQLPTTVGGTANLDGFRKTESGYIFVEAKCREPYSVKDNIYGQKYKELYDFITESDKTLLTIDMDLTKGKEYEMEVVFRYNGEEIKYFDIKQMISHLLGVGTAFLNGKYEIADIHFIYLLFNPTKVLIENSRTKEQIEGIYNNVCDFCNTISFKSLFKVLLEFLQVEKSLGTDKNISDITNKFSFALCDQDSQIIM